jgi:hypothetical protein
MKLISHKKAQETQNQFERAVSGFWFVPFVHFRG